MQRKDLETDIGIEVNFLNQYLYRIYWLQKLVKNPLKFQVIIAASKVSIKSHSKDITSILIMKLKLKMKLFCNLFRKFLFFSHILFFLYITFVILF